VRQRRAQSLSVMTRDGLDGVFHAEGKEWRAQRRVVSPAFSHANLKLSVPSVKMVAKRVVEQWQKAAGNRGI
jgi:cytochrome P450